MKDGIQGKKLVMLSDARKRIEGGYIFRVSVYRGYGRSTPRLQSVRCSTAVSVFRSA